MTDEVTRRLAITGLVQGVWYRESMRREAERLGITGWIRNRPDGSVEALVQGSADAVESITRWARRGPEHARVERVEAFAAESERLSAFEKRPTG
jgi:acylphosphatase